MSKVMILGSGGREHALACWFDRYGHDVFVAPGNAGTAELGENLKLDVNDPQKVATHALHKDVSLVVVGPENLLCTNSADPRLGGLADYWQKEKLAEDGVYLFGPRALKQGAPLGGAMLEGSKIFARNFAQRHGIPIPEYVGFRSGHHDTNLSQAMSHWKHRMGSGKRKLMVVKADGLCGGKGVFVCDDDDEVFRAIRSMPQFKGEGDDFLLEQRISGEEASITVVTDGKDYVAFPHSQDHKRRFDGDRGKNTGGMGAYAPTRLVTPDLEAKVAKEMIEPTIAGLAEDNMPYVGVLYFAIMVRDDQPYLIEYNCRFGDPESQVIIPLMEGDPYELMTACCEGRLEGVKDEFRIRPAYSACVVLCSEDYQNRGGASAKGNEIVFSDVGQGIDGLTFFHAGTKKEGDRTVVDGGRVIGVTAVSEADHRTALELAYAGAERVKFEGKDMRTDIGYRVLELR